MKIKITRGSAPAGIYYQAITGELLNARVAVKDKISGLYVYWSSNQHLKENVEWWIGLGGMETFLQEVLLELHHNEEIETHEIKLGGSSHTLLKQELSTIKSITNTDKFAVSGRAGDEQFPAFMEVVLEKHYERGNVRPEEGDVVVDIGSNYGFFSLYVQRYKPSRVIAVEPFPPVYECLRKNLNNTNTETVNKAISLTTGSEEFVVADIFGQNRLNKFGDKSPLLASSTNDTIQVDTININHFIAQYDLTRIDFLKIDCEGGELDLFNKINKDYLNNNIKKIAMECHSGEIKDTVIKILQSSFELDLSRDNMIHAYAKQQ